MLHVFCRVFQRARRSARECGGPNGEGERAGSDGREAEEHCRPDTAAHFRHPRQPGGVVQVGGDFRKQRAERQAPGCRGCQSRRETRADVLGGGAARLQARAA